MIFKLIYSITIICCSTLIGFILAKTYVERTKLLSNLLSVLQMLETEIVYGNTPLPILFKKIGSKSNNEELERIFLNTANILERKQGQTFEEAWSNSIKMETTTSFSESDIEILLSLGKNLGVSNCDNQIKHIRLSQEELKRNYEMSIMEQNKNISLFRNLGFLLGLTIVIILY